MSGYDKLPGYGGPEPPWWFWALIALGVIGFIALVSLAAYGVI